jgi:dephospho-CoA kinase
VREETERRAADSGADLFVAEIPLLFEGGRGDQFDYTVAVTTPDERRRVWAEERGMGEERRRAIEDRQLSGEEKARLANVVVENDGDLDKLREQAKALVDRALGGRGSVGESGAEEEK